MRVRLAAAVKRRLVRARYGDDALSTLSASRLFQFWIWQVVLRVNSHVPWPVHWTTQIKQPSRIKRGSRFPGMAMGCYIDGRNGIEFGRNVWVGPRVSIISMNHELDDYTRYRETSSIHIGDDCWIGTNAILLPGVRLGRHVVVAAGAVVTKPVKCDNVVVGGNPARIIKKIGSYTGSSS